MFRCRFGEARLASFSVEVGSSAPSAQPQLSDVSERVGQTLKRIAPAITDANRETFVQHVQERAGQPADDLRSWALKMQNALHASSCAEAVRRLQTFMDSTAYLDLSPGQKQMTRLCFHLAKDQGILPQYDSRSQVVRLLGVGAAETGVTLRVQNGTCFLAQSRPAMEVPIVFTPNDTGAAAEKIARYCTLSREPLTDALAHARLTECKALLEKSQQRRGLTMLDAELFLLSFATIKASPVVTSSIFAKPLAELHDRLGGTRTFYRDVEHAAIAGQWTEIARMIRTQPSYTQSDYADPYIAAAYLLLRQVSYPDAASLEELRRKTGHEMRE